MGTKDQSYDYTFVSIDLDDDDLSYNISWEEDGDPQSDVTDFYPNATEATANHSWAMAGIYTMTANATDNKTVSGNTNYVVLIDAWWVKTIGYLLDYDANGIYEIFHSNSTDNETDVEQLENGTYLIDEDGDGEWDWFYDKESDTLTPYSEDTKKEEDYTLWYILILLLIFILIIIGYLASRKKKKPEPKKPEPKKTNNKTTTSKKK